MIIDRGERYRYECKITRSDVDDEFYNSGIFEQRTILLAPCDVQELSLSKSQANYDNAKFAVYLNSTEKVVISSGDGFECDVNGLLIKGKITGVLPSYFGLKLLVADEDTDVVEPPVTVEDLDKDNSVDSKYF